MLDTLLGLAVFAILVLIGAAAWRLARGLALSRTRAGLRILASAAVFGPVTAAGIYTLMNSATVQLLAPAVAHVEMASPAVALTFDDGPDARFADEVLSALRDNSVPATFFVIGENIKANPDVCRRIVSAGHELGNHSYSHERMVFVSYDFIAAELERTDALIQACGQPGAVPFRPPYSKKLLALPLYLYRTGRASIMADIEPDSLSEIGGSAERMTSYALDHARPGSIILLHPWYSGGAESRRAIPLIVQGLKAKGFRFVTVSALLDAGDD